MSRVTLGRVWSELCDMPTPDFDKVNHIEIVPRKIVEMIIEECERNEITNSKYGNYCAENNLKHIREYSESLLKQFEEDKNE